MEVIIECFACMAATVFFALLLEQPRNTLLHTALISSCGFIVYVLLVEEGLPAFFWSGLTVGILCEITARIKKVTATLHLVSGIIPLVPGLGIYRAIMFLAEKDYHNAMRSAVDALGGIGAIALAITLSAMVFSNIRFTCQKGNNNASPTL